MDAVRRFLVGLWIVAIPPTIFIIGYYAGVHAERIAQRQASQR
jgi:hypothetical protein